MANDGVDKCSPGAKPDHCSAQLSTDTFPPPPIKAGTKAVPDHVTAPVESTLGQGTPDKDVVGELLLQSALTPVDKTKPSDQIDAKVKDAFDKDPIGELKKLYSSAVPEQDRQNLFERRLKTMQQTNPELFKAYKEVGESIAGNPLASPEEIGKKLGDALHKAWAGKTIDFNDLSNQDVLGASASMMLAARSTWPNPNDVTKTQHLVDAVEKGMNPDKTLASTTMKVMRDTQAVHTVIWGTGEQGEGEPAMTLFHGLGEVPDATRHNFHL